jgi:hypothetical protein
MVMLAACSKKSSDDGGLKDTGRFENAYVVSFDVEPYPEAGLFQIILYNGTFTFGIEPEPPVDMLWMSVYSKKGDVPADGTYTGIKDAYMPNGLLLDNDDYSFYFAFTETGESYRSFKAGTVKISSKGTTYTIEYDITLDDDTKMTGVYVGPMQIIEPEPED